MASTSSNGYAGVGYAAAFCLAAGLLGGLGKEIANFMAGTFSLALVIALFYVGGWAIRACDRPKKIKKPKAPRNDPWNDFKIIEGTFPAPAPRPLFEIVEDDEVE